MIVQGKRLKELAASLQRIDFDPSTHDGYIDIYLAEDMIATRRTPFTRVAKKIPLQDNTSPRFIQVRLSDLLNTAKSIDTADVELSVSSLLTFKQNTTEISIFMKETTGKPITWIPISSNTIHSFLIKSVTAFVTRPMISSILWNRGEVNSLTTVDESHIGICKWYGESGEDISLPCNGWNMFPLDICIEERENFLILHDDTTMVIRPKPTQVVPKGIEDSISKEKKTVSTCKTKDLRRMIASAVSIAEKESPSLSIKADGQLSVETENRFTGSKFKQAIDTEGEKFKAILSGTSLLQAVAAIPLSIETVKIGTLSSKPIFYIEAEKESEFCISLYMVTK